MGNLITRNIKLESDFKYLRENTDFTEEKLLLFHSSFYIDAPEGRMDKERFCSLFERSFNNCGQLQNNALWKLS